MLSRQQRAYRLMRRASAAQLEGALERAADLYRASLNLHPTAEAYTFLGWTFSLQGHFEHAIALCRMAIRLDPTLGNPYSDIGAYLIELQRFREAAGWLRKATHARRYTAGHAAQYNLGRINEHLGEEGRALECYRQALRLCPECLPATWAWRRLVARTN